MSSRPLGLDQAGAERPHPRAHAAGQSRTLSQAALLGVVLLAAGLRFWHLEASSLWSDEGNTWVLVQRSFAQIARDAAVDIHPPGYYWLLKVWTAAFGADAAGMRSLSALLGTLLVGVVYAIGRSVDRTAGTSLALTTALLLALSPFQIYYSQEARMYMLLALAGAGLCWMLLLWFAAEDAGRPVLGPALGFVLCGAAGLWTHYSFPILLVAAGLAYLWHWGVRRRKSLTGGSPLRSLMVFAAASLAIVLLFLPWLSTAVERVLAWPKGGFAIPFAEGLWLTLRTLAFGPLRVLPDPAWPWLLAAGLLPLLGLAVLVRLRFPQGVALGLWFIAPIGLMAALGLYSDAFLKFLLTASPAWALLTAAAPHLLPRPQAGHAAMGAGAIALALVTLPGYYTSPTVRDNYRGVARYIAATADPAADLVVLDAPGQGDVWAYYDPGVPVLGVPQERPPDPERTLALLEAATADRRQVYALFWATDEADPERLVETWLDRQAFRGLESWQGNLRFVAYSFPTGLTCANLDPPPTFGDMLSLQAHCQPELPQHVAAGQVALVQLHWRATTTPAQRYKISLQLLDPRNQVVAQHDAEPAGGSRPTDTWAPEELVVDNHGLTIPPGTPPGDYPLIAAVYDPASGVRLSTPAGDALPLGTVTVARPAQPFPAAIVPLEHHVEAPLGPVRLAGYSTHRKGFSHAPETPLQPGDLLHVTLLWQAPDSLPPDWPADLTFTLRMGDQTLEAPLAGLDYPTGHWQPGDLVRGEFDIPYDGTGDTLRLEVAGATLRLRR